MSKTTKIWILSAILMISGIIIFALTMSSVGWDFSKLSTGSLENVTTDITESFTDIKISVDTSDVSVLFSADNTVKVISTESERLRHEIKVENGTLKITAVDERHWYEHIGIYLTSPKVTLLLPKGVYGALDLSGHTGDVKTSAEHTFSTVNITVTTGEVECSSSAKNVNLNSTTGSLYLSDVSAQRVSLSASTGDIKAERLSVGEDLSASLSTGDAHFTDVNCGSFSFESSTGDLILTRLVSRGNLSCNLTTGDVIFDHSDAAEISVTTSTGDVKGTLLSMKRFITDICTGTKRVPEGTEGGSCKITVTTGDVIIEIAE